jgi:5-methylcytosine-specific restriction endonuclease McrA
MFYIEADERLPRLTIGWNGGWNMLELGDFGFHDIATLDDWEPVAALVLERLKLPVEDGLRKLQAGIDADHEIDAAVAELYTPVCDYPPWHQTEEWPLEQVREALAERRLRAVTKEAKRFAIRQRRVQFSAARNDLVLALLDAGHLYVCAEVGCAVCTNLTVDHITPLSRGGTDKVENLRFLCRPHNSQKGDRISP